MKPAVRIALLGAAVAIAGAAVASARGRPALALGPAATLADSGASVPTVALSADGARGYVAWVASAGGQANVYVAPAGGRPVRVNDRPGDAAPHEQAPAQVAVGVRGEVYLLWQNNREIPGRQYPASELRFSRSEDGGRSWSPATTVNSDRGGAPSSHTFHDLLVGPDGTLYASWLDGRLRDSARAGRPRPAAPAAPGNHGHHDDPSLPSNDIRVVRSRDGGRSWEPEMIVDGGVCPCCRSALAVGPDGSIYVAWRKVFAGDVRDVVVARLAPGGSAFAAPVRVHEDAWVFHGCPHAGPALAVGADGAVDVVWYTGRDGRQGLWRARAESGLAFGPAEPVLTGGFVPPSQAALAADGERVIAVWDDRRSPRGAPGLAVLGGQAEALAPAGRSPSVAAARGRVLAAWMDGGAVRMRDSERGGR